MRTCYYYAISDLQNVGGINAGSIASNEYPLTVNCAGRLVESAAFTTDNPAGREDYYLIYVERGELAVFMDGSIRTVRSGGAVLFPPHYHYKYTFSGNSTLSYLWAHFTGSHAGRFLADCGFGNLPCLSLSESDIKIISGFEKLFDIFREHEPLQRQKLACRLESILLDIASNRNRADNVCRLTKSLGYIHAAYNREIKIPELAKMESLSNSRYIAVFKKHMGMTPSDYIIGLRINVACELLKSHDRSIKEVAASVGYQDPHFFGKIFKRKMGLSPKSYRERNSL